MSALDDQTILRETATRVLGAHGLVLEDVEIRQGGGMPQVRIIVDLPDDQLGSADLDAVAEASRELSEAVDADDAVLGSAPMLLEVTTPGVERALTRPRHFRRSRGRLLALAGVDGTAYRARLLAVDGESLHLRQEPGRDDRGRPQKMPAGTSEQLVLPIAEVESARVEVEFDPPEDLEQMLADAEASLRGSDGTAPHGATIPDGATAPRDETTPHDATTPRDATATNGATAQKEI